MAEIDRFVVVQEVWNQSSGNYDAVRNTKTLIVGPATTIADVMKWAKQHDRALGVGDVIISREEVMKP